MARHKGKTVTVIRTATADDLDRHQFSTLAPPSDHSLVEHTDGSTDVVKTAALDMSDEQSS
jgi:hypothetical protein